MIQINLDDIKKVFILEDSKERIAIFRKWLTGKKVFITMNPDKAIAELHRTKYDLILLDHDLDELGIDPKYHALREAMKTSGLPVAEAIKYTPNAETMVVVHSMNPVGARNMMAAHPFNSIQIPWHMLKYYISDMMQCPDCNGYGRTYMTHTKDFSNFRYESGITCETCKGSGEILKSKRGD